MVFDVLRGYVHVATGLTDVTRQRAKDIADLLVTQGVDAGSKSQEQVQALTDELMENSRTNRDLLTGLIRTEVERAVNRLGFVREDELAAVRQHVHRLEDQLAKEQERATGALLGTAGASSKAAKSAAGAASKTASGVAGVAARVAGGAAAAMLPENAVSVAPKSRDSQPAEPAAQDEPAAAKQAPAKKTAAKKAPAKKTAAKKAPAKKTAAKKAPAKKTAAKKAPAKKDNN
ncbi:MAG: polyhydroxyalkanoate synthesis protein PhaF [Actinomycetia bacterium]|nr:polyhydroxyalkanoate synthesis protein PhaF [Actinomycetes bacterium]